MNWDQIQRVDGQESISSWSEDERNRIGGGLEVCGGGHAGINYVGQYEWLSRTIIVRSQPYQLSRHHQNDYHNDEMCSDDFTPCRLLKNNWNRKTILLSEQRPNNITYRFYHS